MKRDGVRMSGYEDVAEAIRRAIAEGDYSVGDRLPSIQQLADHYGVSHMTIKRAMEVLKLEGLLVSKSGVRTQVVATPNAAPQPLQDQIDALRRTVDDLTERLAAIEAHVSQSSLADRSAGERE